MGDPKFARKRYATPSHPWDGARIAEENQIIHKYGLKNKRELWKSETLLKDLRRQARDLQARLRFEDEQSIKERDALIDRLISQGLLKANADLNDVLSLEVEALLARRLQTMTYLKGFAHTMKQARQFIVHGHIAVGGRKVTVPGYMVLEDQMDHISFYSSSPLTSELHPERPEADFVPEIVTVKEERRLADEREREVKKARELERIKAMTRRLQTEEEAPPEEEGAEGEDITEVTPEEGEAKPSEAEGEEKPKEEKGEEKPKGEKGEEKPKGEKGEEKPKEEKGEEKPKEEKGEEKPKEEKGADKPAKQGGES
jgi:small subunit ribosomal protein S4